MAALANVWRQGYQPIPAEYKTIESVVRRSSPTNGDGAKPTLGEIEAQWAQAGGAAETEAHGSAALDAVPT